ncbi:MAG TPA: glycosyltransferase family 2 protein [bacterium]
MTDSTPTHRSSVSAVLIVFNEERNLAACLESVKWADEVIVVDGHSTDRTPELARQSGAKVYQNTFSGYGPQKQFALERAACGWILSIDADERVTPKLRDEILKVLDKSSGVDGFEIPFKNVFFGKWLKHSGLYPDYHLRLFRRTAAEFTSAKIHESVLVRGRVGRLNHPMLHCSYPTVASYVQKMNRYTALLAEGGATFRLNHMLFSPVSKFFRLYLGRRGYLDGFTGLVYCLLAAFFNFVKDAKAWEKSHS